MQIVIDIPKEMYINALNGYLCGSETLVNAIKNGTPLPKGHGRLIDADKLREEIFVVDSYSEEPVKQQISDAPTIIEADKESELNESK